MSTPLLRGRRILQGFAFVLLLATALLGTARNVLADGPVSVVITSADDSAFPTVSTVVLADQDGNPLPSLTPGNVSAAEDGKPADVLSVTSSTDAAIPLELVLAIDTSGSMAGVTLPQAKVAATGLVNSLGSGDRAALINFDTQVRVDQQPTTDLSAVASAIGELVANGNTALYDAVGKATDLAGQAQNVRRAVVLLTDGEDYGGLSTLTREGSLAKAVASHTIFYTIGVGSQVDTAYLSQLAQQTGGRFFLAPQASGLAAIYSAIEGRLRSYFVITVRSSADAAGSDRTIDVSIRSNGASFTGSLAYTSRRPPLLPETPRAARPAPAAPAAVQTAVVPSSPPGRGRSWPAYAAGGAVVLVPLVALALLLASRRRQSNLKPVSVATQPGRLISPQSTPVHDGGAAAPQISVLVEENGKASAHPLRSTLTLGTSPDNDVVLGSGGGAAPHHARLWLRDGRVMLHQLDAAGESLVAGRAVEWASLEPGETVTIGDATLTVKGAPPV